MSSSGNQASELDWRMPLAFYSVLPNLKSLWPTKRTALIESFSHTDYDQGGPFFNPRRM